MSNSKKPHIDINQIHETVNAVKADRDLAKVTFTMHANSGGGIAMESRTGALVQNGQADQSREGRFSLIADEPVSLLGTDRGVSPAEYALNSLASCYTVTLASMAASKGIELDEIKLDLYFDIDLSGFLGIDMDVRNGAQAIRVDVSLKSAGADDASLQALVDALPSHSPLHDTLANPVKIVTKRV